MAHAISIVIRIVFFVIVYLVLIYYTTPESAKYYSLTGRHYFRIGVAKVLTYSQSTPTRRGEKNMPDEKLPERVGVYSRINVFHNTIFCYL
jgi:hypothetical protein